MSAISIHPPFPVFTDLDGQPLESGYIYIGAANLPPITNPLTVYWNSALTNVAVQPIRTSGGYPVNSGTPARLFVNANYSIQVLDSKGSVVYSSLQDNLFSGGGGAIAANATGNGVQTVFAVAFIPLMVYINGVYQNQNTYSVASGNVTFTQAPPQTSIIEFVG